MQLAKGTTKLFGALTSSLTSVLEKSSKIMFLSNQEILKTLAHPSRKRTSVKYTIIRGIT